MKVNRFKQNEQKQERMIEEMEASITAFLTDIEDENSRLIESLKRVDNTQQHQSTGVHRPEQESANVAVEERESVVAEISSTSVKKAKDYQSYNAPRAYVQNAYVAHKKEQKTSEKETPVVKIEEPLVQSFEERVHDMYMRGMSIDEIAKQLSRGKTEIALLLKFQNKST